MDRRDFLKAMSLGMASVAIASSLAARQQGRSAVDINRDEVLGEADNRIESHRTGQATLRLLGCDGKALGAGLTVKIEQRRHKFLFGCNIFKLNRCRTAEDNAGYAERFAGLLNYATLPFYWWNYEREKGKPDYARTEELVRWCKAHHITAKGHPLAWNWGQPPWLPEDPTAAMQAQLERIRRCVQRFKADIDIWDVVNEATHYDRDKAKRDAPTLTEAIRRMGIGGYVRQAFKAARQSNPKATLVINDYRTDRAYAEKVISELVDEQGRPAYDVIGIQSHMHGGYWGAKRTWEVCEYFARFGRPLHFTETTIVSGPRTRPGWNTTAEGEKRQAQQVSEFYRILFSHPAVEAITWWDFTDQGAWQRAPAGLVRADMTPKPAYQRLFSLIKGRWWTQAEAAVGAGGETQFRGFFGQYKVTAQLAGRELSGTFEFDKSTKTKIDVQLS